MKDPWDYWIFNIDVGGGMNAEESVKGYSIISSIDADRVTEDWKIKNSFELIYEEESFSNDDEKSNKYAENLGGKFRNNSNAYDKMVCWDFW